MKRASTNFSTEFSSGEEYTKKKKEIATENAKREYRNCFLLQILLHFVEKEFSISVFWAAINYNLTIFQLLPFSSSLTVVAAER